MATELLGDTIVLRLTLHGGKSHLIKGVFKEQTPEELWRLALILYFLCHQHLCCVAYRDHFVIQFCGVVGHRPTLYSGQYLKNGLSDLIQIWHVDVTAYQGVLYSLVTLNSH